MSKRTVETVTQYDRGNDPTSLDSKWLDEPYSSFRLDFETTHLEDRTYERRPESSYGFLDRRLTSKLIDMTTHGWVRSHSNQ